MDPLSLAASVAGLTSLGIQVTDGISAYLDALKCRDEELKSIRAQNAALGNTIAAIQRTSASIHQLSGTAVTVVNQSIKSCTDDLDALDDFVAQLAGSDRSTWRLRVKDKFRALHFAFDRPKISQLSTRIERSKTTLHLAIGDLGLRLHAEKISSVDSSLRSNATEFLLVHSEIAATHTPVMDIRNRIPRLEDKVDLIEPQLETHSNLITHQISEGTKTMSEQIGHVTETVQASFHMQQEFQEQLAGMSRSLQTFLALHGHGSAVPDEKESLARMAVGLAAKPAALEEACNTFATKHDLQRVSGLHQRLEHANAQSRFPASSTETSIYGCSACICRGRMQKSRAYSRLGPFYVYSDHTEEGHSRHCPLYRAVPIKEERTYGARLVGLTRIVEIAVGISFGARFGAGGRSISPQFTYFRTVDRRTDPAFRVIECLGEVLRKYIHRRPPNFNDALEQKALKKMIQCFEEGRSSPYAVDSENQTLMHCVFKPGWLLARWQLPSIHFIKGLLSNGVPAISYDIYGQSPVNGTLMESDLFEVSEYLLGIESGAMPINTTASGSGPLIMAVKTRDREQVLALLARHAEAIEEQNYSGQTALFVAAYENSLPLFPELVEAAKMANILQKRDNNNNTMLNVLDRREALRQLAASNQWALRSIQQILTKGDVLDLYSIQVSALLQQNGIKVPGHLIPYRSQRSKYQSIYYLIDNISMAEQLFELGFRDIDYGSRYGRPPLAKVGNPSMALWLLEHGADPTRVRKLKGKVSGKDRWISSAHYAMYNLGECLSSRRSASFQAASLITVTTASNYIHDGCFCACSSDGCTPFICYLKGRWDPEAKDLFNIHRDFHNIFQNLMVEDAKLLYCSAMRFELFEVLELKHTCCYSRSLRTRWDPNRTMDRDDILEIQDEEADLIETVEYLSSDFESGLADVEGDLRDLQAYYDHYWESRVLAKLEEIKRSRMTDEERRKADLLGVVWESDKKSDSKSRCSDFPVGWTEDNWEHNFLLFSPGLAFEVGGEAHDARLALGDVEGGRLGLGDAAAAVAREAEPEGHDLGEAHLHPLGRGPGLAARLGQSVRAGPGHDVGDGLGLAARLRGRPLCLRGAVVGLTLALCLRRLTVLLQPAFLPPVLAFGQSPYSPPANQSVPPELGTWQGKYPWMCCKHKDRSESEKYYWFRVATPFLQALQHTDCTRFLRTADDPLLSRTQANHRFSWFRLLAAEAPALIYPGLPVPRPAVTWVGGCLAMTRTRKLGPGPYR
ncbi:hypothetical protein PG984_015414 [Apiospora sp. TS-2023a]